MSGVYYCSHYNDAVEFDFDFCICSFLFYYEEKTE